MTGRDLTPGGGYPRPGHAHPGAATRSAVRVTLFDVTNPWLAGNQELAARTLEDDAGNRYVLLTVARYLDLLQHAREARHGTAP